MLTTTTMASIKYWGGGVIVIFFIFLFFLLLVEKRLYFYLDELWKYLFSQSLQYLVLTTPLVDILQLFFEELILNPFLV